MCLSLELMNPRSQELDRDCSYNCVSLPATAGNGIPDGNLLMISLLFKGHLERKMKVGHVAFLAETRKVFSILIYVFFCCFFPL